MDRTDLHLHQSDLPAPPRNELPAPTPAPQPKGGPGAGSGRRLCSTERGIWKFDQAASMNTAAAVRVRGPLDEAVLRAGLDALQARHPHLRSRIDVDASGQPSFRFDAASPLPLRALRAPAEAWLAEYERELNERIRWHEGPLGRCVLLQHGDDDATILLVVHHAVCDGESLNVAVRDLIRACARAADGLPPALEPLADTRSIEARLPERLWGRKGLRLLGEFLRDEARLASKHGKPLRVSRDRREGPASARRFRCRPRAFDEAQTARLLARARDEQTTVHGALAAAMILGALEDAGADRAAYVALGSPVNVRGAVTPPVGDDVGYYVSMVPYRAAVRPNMPFWALARDVRDDTARRLTRGDAPLMLDLFEGIFRALGGPRAAPPAIAERWAKAVSGTMLLSNLGRQGLEFDAGRLRVEGLSMGGALSALGEFGAVANTFQRKLTWNFIWAEPPLTAEGAERLITAIVARLERELSR